MIVYYPFWKKQYLFHPDAIGNQTLMSIYQPYNLIPRILRQLWLKYNVLQNLFRNNVLPAYITTILEDIDANSSIANYVWSADTGEKGNGKTRLLLMDIRQPGHYRFIKIAKTEMANNAIRNEAVHLSFLEGFKAIKAPSLLKSGKSGPFSYLVTDVFFNGKKLNSSKLSVELIETIVQITYTKQFTTQLIDGQELIYTFAHGDFCPWNILERRPDIKIIDWEMCGIYPLGYDLFTFIFQTPFLLSPNEKIRLIIQKNSYWINLFFSKYNVTNWWPYFTDFATIKFSQYKDDKKLQHLYNGLLQYALEENNNN